MLTRKAFVKLKMVNIGEIKIYKGKYKKQARN